MDSRGMHFQDSQQSETTKKPDKEIQVWNTDLEAFRTVYSVGIKQEEEEAEECSKPTKNIVAIFAEVYALTDKIEDSKLYTAYLCEFITARTADNEWPLAAATVRRAKTLFSENADSVLVRGSAVEGAPQRYMHTVLRPRVLYLCHYSLKGRNPAER